MKRSFRILVPSAFGCVVAVGGGSSCKPRVEQQCYEEIEYIGPQTGMLPPDFPYCAVTYSTVQDPPDGYGFTHLVATAFLPTEDQPCDPCNVEHLDQLLRAAIEQRMSQGSPSCARMEPGDPVGLCVHPPDETSESDQCRVRGVYFSNYHDVPTTAGCTDCRENGTCDHNNP